MLRGVRMSGWGWCLVLLGVLFGVYVLLTLAGEYYLGSGVHAEYPDGVSFTGGGHFSRMTYYGVAWVRDADDPRPCPLVVHLAGGDLTAADLADPDALRARGWVSVTDDAQLAAGLPLLLEYREGDYAVHITYHAGVPVAVTVGFAIHGVAAWPEAQGIPVSFRGGRVSLPAPEQDLIRALGPPTRRTRGAAY